MNEGHRVKTTIFRAWKEFVCRQFDEEKVRSNSVITMLEDNLDLEQQRAALCCRQGYFTGTTRRTALWLFFWAACAALVLIARELWLVIDPTFINYWKAERESADYEYHEFQYYINAAFAMLVALSLPVCVYYGAAKMSKPMLHLFSGYTMVCSFFTFVWTFNYFVLCNAYNAQYCYSLGGVELLSFVTFVMSCSLSLNLLRALITYDASDDTVSGEQPQQETFGSFYNSWTTSTPQETPSTYAPSTSQSTSYPTATATVVSPGSQVEMATVSATPVVQAVPVTSRNKPITSVSPVVTANGYTGPQTTSASTYYPQADGFVSSSAETNFPSQQENQDNETHPSDSNATAGNFVTKA